MAFLFTLFLGALKGLNLATVDFNQPVAPQKVMSIIPNARVMQFQIARSPSALKAGMACAAFIHRNGP